MAYVGHESKGLDTKNLRTVWQSEGFVSETMFQVELEGFEPSSKRGINELSTCVVSS